jgi:TM2 domain-containing membrane protein YozV
MADRVWVLDDPDEQSRVRKKHTKKHTATAPPRAQQNPAAAFSWSILIWGGGQIYRNQGAVGALLILLMVNFYAHPVWLWFYRGPILAWLQGFAITPSQMLAAATLCYFSGLLVWLISAEHAYLRTCATRTTPFRGIGSAWLPGACSLVLPGWGQFLNGQAKKGTFFLLIALLGLFAVPTALGIWIAWPSLDTAVDRLFWEKVLVVLLLTIPAVLLIWPLSGFDALKVSRDEMKKEPLLKRLECANNRRRIFGWGHEVVPFFKRTAVLAVVLVLFSTVAYYYGPRDYYFARLQQLQIHLSHQHMVLIPQLIDRLLHHA